jgi:hypothetical protein
MPTLALLPHNVDRARFIAGRPQSLRPADPLCTLRNHASSARSAGHVQDHCVRLCAGGCRCHAQDQARRATGAAPPGSGYRDHASATTAGRHGAALSVPDCEGCVNRESGPAFKFVASVCAGTGGAVNFPWSKGLDYNPDSIQYAPDFALHPASFGFQEFLKLLEFRD